MARTFIGELVLRLKDEMSRNAKSAANNLDTSVDRIQRAAKKLNQTSWGGQFEERLRKLGSSSTDIDKLRKAWDELHTSMSSRNLSKSLQAMEKSNFKTASLTYFADISTKAKEAETNIGKMHGRWKEAMKDMAVYGTTGALMYGSVNALRGGFNASAEYQREIFRQENANISTKDQLRIAAEADRLTSLYPSAGLTNVMEMARQARNMMGDTERGLKILPDLVKGFVALQTAKGTDQAPGELSELLRGIDNAGKNVGGDLGIKQTQEVLAGLIRAAQMEGRELDVGSMWAFMRRAKIAGPGFSTEFLANVAPALIQDMTAPGAGTALSSAFQSFVIGSNAVASKKNIAEQERLGIRSRGKLVNSQLMGENPYQWAKDVLLPALQKDGVDIGNDTALAEAIAKLSRNTPATAMMTKMLQQREQMDRLIEQYKSAAGPDAADQAMAKDPFVAWKGFTESWRELATSLKGMPEVVGGLNMFTGAIQRFATALREQGGGAQALLAGAGLGAGLATWKVGSAIWGLITAGTNLNAAALSLEAAAISLGGPGAMSNLAKKPGLLSNAGNVLPWLGFVGSRIGLPAAAAYTTFRALDDIPHAGYESALKDNPNMFVDMERDRRMRSEFPGGFEGGMHLAGAGIGPRPGSWDSAVADAQRAGDRIKDALDVTARPTIDNASLQQALNLVNAINAGISKMGGALQSATASVSSAMNRNFADHGVKP